MNHFTIHFLNNEGLVYHASSSRKKKREKRAEDRATKETEGQNVS